MIICIVYSLIGIFILLTCADPLSTLKKCDISTLLFLWVFKFRSTLTFTPNNIRNEESFILFMKTSLE